MGDKQTAIQRSLGAAIDASVSDAGDVDIPLAIRTFLRAMPNDCVFLHDLADRMERDEAALWEAMTRRDVTNG